MDLRENIAKVRADLEAAARAAGRDPSEITLLAATKTQSSETIRAAIAAGITACGENRVQELTAIWRTTPMRGRRSTSSAIFRPTR